MTRVPTLLRTRPGRKSAPVSWYPDPDSEGFERAVVFEPGFGMDRDESGKPSSQRYGRKSMNVRFLLRGPHGAAQFLMSTGWTPEAAANPPGGENDWEWMHHGPSGWDLGYHAHVAQYEGHESGACQYLDCPCFYDGSGLAADDVLAALFDRGADGVWDALRAVHDSLLVEGGAS